jgi:hypothetical protein
MLSHVTVAGSVRSDRIASGNRPALIEQVQLAVVGDQRGKDGQVCKVLLAGRPVFRQLLALIIVLRVVQVALVIQYP